MLNCEPLYYIHSIESQELLSIRRQTMKRRHFLQMAAGATATALVERSSALTRCAEHIALCIDKVSVELAPGVVVRTTAYNGQIPGSVLRMREGIPTSIVLTNLTSRAESVQWYGLPRSGAFAAKMQDPIVEPGATQIHEVIPGAVGTRWYRAHSMASTNALRSAENGQFGFLIVSSRNEAGAYDQEVLLAVRHWEAKPERSQSVRYACFNDKLMGAGEPIRVRTGQRVLFRFLNASEHEETCLHLPGHRFEVIALDGNPVPRQAAVDVLSMAPGERIDAIVKMDSPGTWILGSVDDAERARGLGIHIEYADQSGAPRWSAPAALDWSYTRFSSAHALERQTGQASSVFLERSSGYDGHLHWTFNGRSYPDLGSLPIWKSEGLRLKMMNTTGQNHFVHLPHCNFALARVHQVPVAGVVKDTIRLERYNVVEADVIPNRQRS